MRDEIDELFADDLTKLGKKKPPLELQVNAARVKAAQDPDKPGAEKPDLGAPGKGKGGKDPMLKSASFFELLRLNPNSRELEQAFNLYKRKTGKDIKSMTYADQVQYVKAVRGHAKTAEADMSTSQVVKGPDGVPVTVTRHYKKKFFGKGLKPTGMSISSPGMLRRKQAALADEFEVRQQVGVEDPVGWERPDVAVEGQVTDRIDDHFVGWMQEKADEDVVKVASKAEAVLSRLIDAGGKDAQKAILNKAMMGSAAKGALGATGAIGAGFGVKKVYDKGKEKGWEEAMGKTAGVIEHDENLDLLAKLRKKAGDVQGDSDDVA